MIVSDKSLLLRQLEIYVQNKSCLSWLNDYHGIQLASLLTMEIYGKSHVNVNSIIKSFPRRNLTKSYDRLCSFRHLLIHQYRLLDQLLCSPNCSLLQCFAINGIITLGIKTITRRTQSESPYTCHLSTTKKKKIWIFNFFFFTRQKFYSMIIYVYMCVKLHFRDLKLDFYFPHSTNTYSNSINVTFIEHR